MEVWVGLVVVWFRDADRQEEVADGGKTGRQANEVTMGWGEWHVTGFQRFETGGRD